MVHEAWRFERWRFEKRREHVSLVIVVDENERGIREKRKLTWSQGYRPNHSRGRC